jgi:hypothetical protein
MDVSQDKPKKAARDRNLMAISCLTMSFQDDALMNIIEQSETADWPSGLAHCVIDELFKKYRPVDIISRVEMRTRLSQVSMKADDDPRVLFSQLATIQSAYNSTTQKMDPYDLIAVVLEKVPNKNKSILTAEQRNKGANLSLTDLNNCMTDLFRTMNPNRVDPKEDTEVALFAASTKFKGNCRNYKKPGTCPKIVGSRKQMRKIPRHFARADIVAVNIWIINVGRIRTMRSSDRKTGFRGK